MSLFVKKKNRVFIASLPKAGTHLLIAFLEHLWKYKYKGVILSRSFAYNKKNLPTATDDSVLVGVDAPALVKRTVIHKFLKKIPSYGIVPGHTAYNVELENLLSEEKYRCLVISRDPRDVVVSHVHYILKEQHFLHSYYNSLEDFDRCLMISIEGIKMDGIELKNIADRVLGITDWNKSEMFLPLRFEDVIGLRGGGELDRQLETFRKIVTHLGIDVNDDQIKKAATDMFGKGYSFRKGNIGGWREVFKDEHKSCFKELAGDLLIELGYEEDMDW